MPPEALTVFQALLQRRLAHEPVSYLLGEREFYGRVFRTDPRALVPRPETELLVDIGLQAVQRWRARGVEPRVVDVGTGAGPIAVSLAAECGVSVLATDRSWAALSLARENARRLLDAAGRVQFVQADLLAPLRGPLHLLLANLPYVPQAADLPPDVRLFEPPQALFAGPLGLDLNQRLLREAAPLLVRGGTLALELEPGQAEPLAEMARGVFPGAEVAIHLDLQGLARVLSVRTG